MRRFFRENSLSIVMFGLFFVFLAAQTIAGHREFNQDQRDYGEPVVDYVAYLGTGHFVEAVFENWESEFLQMGSFVLFTIFLRQKDRPSPRSLKEKSPSTRTLAHPAAGIPPGRCAEADSCSQPMSIP